MLYLLVFLFVVFGAFFAYVGYSLVSSNRRKLATWIHVEGTVIELVGKPYATARGPRLVYAPKFRYTVHGAERTVTSGTASWPPEFAVGDTVGVIVNPENTSEADVLGRSTSVGYAFVAGGLVVTTIGLLFTWAVLTGRVP
jgi:hypothetical protein